MDEKSESRFHDCDDARNEIPEQQQGFEIAGAELVEVRDSAMEGLTEISNDMMQDKYSQQPQNPCQKQSQSSGNSAAALSKDRRILQYTTWTHSQTSWLLKLYKKHQAEFNDKSLKKKTVWAKLAEELNRSTKLLWHFTGEQAYSRWKNLTMRYRQTLKLINKTGRDWPSINCRYFFEIQAILHPGRQKHWKRGVRQVEIKQEMEEEEAFEPDESSSSDFECVVVQPPPALSQKTGFKNFAFRMTRMVTPSLSHNSDSAHTEGALNSGFKPATSEPTSMEIPSLAQNSVSKDPEDPDGALNSKPTRVRRPSLSLSSDFANNWNLRQQSLSKKIKNSVKQKKSGETVASSNKNSDSATTDAASKTTKRVLSVSEEFSGLEVVNAVKALYQRQAEQDQLKMDRLEIMHRQNMQVFTGLLQYVKDTVASKN